MDRLERIHKIVRILKESRRKITRERLWKACNVSRSTIQRDMDCLRDFYGCPLVWDGTRGTYYLEEGKQWDLPGLWFSEGELYALQGIDILWSGLEAALLNRRQIKVTSLARSRSKTKTLIHKSEGPACGAFHFVHLSAC